MATEKTWQYASPSNLGTTGDSTTQFAMFLVALKAALISMSFTGRWTIYGCCGKNGGGALIAPSSLPDTTDRWTVGADVQTGGGAASEQGWLILYNSTLALYLVLSVTGSYGAGTFMITKTAPTLNGTNAKYRPTMTDATGFDNETIYGTITSSTYRHQMHPRVSTQGHFIVVSTCESNASFEDVWGLVPVEPTRAGDTSPVALMAWGYSYAVFSAEHVSGVISAKGMFRTWVPLGTTPVTAIGMEYYMRTAPNYVLSDFTTDVDGALPDLPLVLYDITPGSKGIKGKVIDVALVSSGANDGDTAPTSTVEGMVVGPLWIPADRAIVW